MNNGLTRLCDGVITALVMGAGCAFFGSSKLKSQYKKRTKPKSKKKSAKGSRSKR